MFINSSHTNMAATRWPFNGAANGHHALEAAHARSRPRGGQSQPFLPSPPNRACAVAWGAVAVGAVAVTGAARRCSVIIRPSQFAAQQW